MDIKERNKQLASGALIIIFILLGLFITIMMQYKSERDLICYEEHVKYEIDSVQYHPSGFDNTLQVSPYWKLRLGGTNIFVTSYQSRAKGDSISMIKRIYISKSVSK
jgi:hypothetical protein